MGHRLGNGDDGINRISFILEIHGNPASSNGDFPGPAAYLLICTLKEIHLIPRSTYKNNMKTTLATKFSRFAPSDLIHFIKYLKFVQVSIAIL